MNPTGYPVLWRGRKLTARDLDDNLKNDFCVWLYNHMLDNARRRMTLNQYRRFENQLTAAPPEWTSLPDGSVLAALDKPAPRRELMRFILGLKRPEDDAEHGMDDIELMDMIAEKEADADSDLARAMRLIREAADPKAQPGGPSSPRPAAASEPTPPSATSPSDSAGTTSAA